MGGFLDRKVAKVGAAFAVAHALFYAALRGLWFDSAFNAVHSAWFAFAENWPIVRLYVDRLLHGTATALAASIFVLMVATVLVPLGFAARTVARARVRAGHRDVMATARAWTLAHPSFVRPSTAILPAAFAMWVTWRFWDEPYVQAGPGRVPLTPITQLAFMALWGIPATFGACGWTALARLGLRALVAPVMDEGEAANVDVAADEIRFDAVAVTPRTRGAVGALAALSTAMVAWMASLPPRALFQDAHVVAALAAYTALALGGAALFRRASRIAVGLDGVFVTGSSRTRFYAYRDLDYVHAEGSDIVLVRGTRVVLRLQLHGKDATRCWSGYARRCAAPRRSETSR